MVLRAHRQRVSVKLRMPAGYGETLIVKFHHGEIFLGAKILHQGFRDVRFTA